MFTGLVEEVGKVREIKKSSKGAKLKVECKSVLEGTKIGDSIAVNGVCLTVVELGENFLSFDISYETLRRSSLSLIKPGSPVNLERALKLGDRLGGHILQGHVDTTTKITAIKREGEGYTFTFKLPKEYTHLVVEKGSIGIDGISLTIANTFPDSFTVAVIPHTFEKTNLKFKKPGDVVNLEFDIIAKYVEKMLKEKNYLFK
ncbi:riboflavin synthase [Thermovibrio sp.]